METPPVEPPITEPISVKKRRNFILPFVVAFAVLLVAGITAAVLYFVSPPSTDTPNEQAQSQSQTFEETLASAVEKRDALAYEEALTLYTKAKDMAVSEGKDEMQIESIQYEIDALNVQIKDAVIQDASEPEVPTHETEVVDGMTIIRPAEISE